MSTVLPNDQPYRERLVAQLQAKYSLSPRVRDAFLATPRHRFIDSYFERVDGAWIQVNSTDRSAQQWLETIYSDCILVTSYTPTGWFQSSSSQPTVMATMLEHLDVQPGQKILEIGTGTGYNAALLSFLTGSPSQVTSIEIDPDLVAQAILNIEHVVGPGALILAGDGNLGVPFNAPYDRIIATASVPKVPQAWIDQLALGGKLVCILQSGQPPVGGILVAERIAEGEVTGHIVARASFIPMRSQAQGSAPNFHKVFQGERYASFPLDPQFAAHRFWSSPHLQFFLYQTLPDLTMTISSTGSIEETKTLLSLGSGEKGYVAFETQQVVLYGERSPYIWQRYLETVTLFDDLQQPAITDYGFEGGNLSIQTPHGIVWPFSPDD
jgi:protein-L-isoaspartate(D-aspartate) O-methyltransferase